MPRSRAPNSRWNNSATNLLIEFVNTLDSTFKKLQTKVSNISGVSQLTISQFQYIDTIHELKQPTITEIAHKLSIAKASVSNSINKLIEKGFVTKTQSSQDKRVYHITLTEKGNSLIHAKHLALKEYGDFINTALSEEEAEQFKSILNKLVRLFKTT